MTRSTALTFALAAVVCFTALAVFVSCTSDVQVTIEEAEVVTVRWREHECGVYVTPDAATLLACETIE